MSNSQGQKTRARLRIAITFAACVGLIALALVQFAPDSTAQRSAQRAAATKKRVRPRFVPGEVLVRYRSESIAQHRTGRSVLAARSGELLTVDVERRRGSDLVPGYRLVHVAPEDTLKTIEALR